MTDIVCIRCGICCHFFIDGKKKKCKHLVILPSKKTLCRVFKKRLGRKIDKKMICMTREDCKYNYPGCPLNALHPEKPEVKCS